MKKTIYIVYLLIYLISFQMQAQGPQLPQACTGSRVRYGVSGLPHSVFNWEIQGGTIIGVHNDSVDVQWGINPSMGMLKVTEHTMGSCVAAPVYAYVVVSSPKLLKIEKQISVCLGQTADIIPKGDFTKYLWNTGETSKIIKISKEGWYKLQATDTTGCVSTDSVYLTVNRPPKLNLGNDTTICSTSLQLDAGEGAFYNWSNNAITRTIVVNDEKKGQTFWVEVTGENGCTTTDTINIFPCKGQKMEGVPNTFTPNGDQFNDTWNIPGLEAYSNVSIEVFDRWGRLVFRSKNGLPSGGWDGTSKGKPLPMDSYYYIINLNDGSDPIPGTVTIIR